MEKYCYVLTHSGIKGMKWGVRRYQNKDGTLTPAGKKRYLSDDGRTLSEAGKKKFENKDGSLNKKGKRLYEARDKKMREELSSMYRKSGTNTARDSTLAKNALKDETEFLELEKKLNNLKPKEKTRLEKTKGVVDAASTTVNQISNAERQSRPKPVKMKMDLSKMSDEQMRKEINRAMLEKQYNDMFAPQQRDNGREIAGNIINGVGTTLGIAGSALGIALAIKELKG